MTRYLDVPVLEVVSGGPDSRVAVQLGSDDDSYTVLSCVGLRYAPRVGDIVRVDMDSVPGQPFVLKTMTPGRTWDAPPLSLTISAAAPTDPDYQGTSAIYVKNGSVWAVYASTSPPPTSAGSLTVSPVASGTWDSTNGWRDGLLRQGVFPGSGAAQCTGLWLYRSDAFAPAVGKTLTGIAVRIGRAAGIGTPYTPKRICLVEHAYTGPTSSAPVTSRPTATDIELGASGMVSDPIGIELAYATDLVAGTAKGLGIASGLADDYLAVLGDSGSGTIVINWSG